MSVNFISPSTVLNPMYFRPSDYRDAFAIVLKPLEEIGPERGQREMRCAITVFETEADLDAGRPTDVLPDARVSSGAIFRQLARALQVDGIIAGYIDQGDMTEHHTRPWIIEDLEPDVQQKVADVWAEVVA